LDSAIHQVRSEFEELGREARAIREQITFLEQRKQECAAQRSDEHRIQTRLGSLASELERLARVEQEIVDLDRQLRELRAAERTDPQLRELEQRLRELEQRLAGRRTVRLAPHPQELSELFLMHEREAQAVQEQMAALERRRSELSAQLCEESRIRAELARIVTELDRLAALEQEVGTLERELEELRRSERTDPHLLALQRQLEEHEHELRSLPYDEGQHRAIERRLAELDSVPDELHALEQARFALAFTRERIVHLEQRRAQIEEELATLQAALNAKAPPEAEYTAAQRELAEARQVLARLEAAVQAVQAELGAVRQQLRDAEAAAEEASVLSQQIERLTREQAVLEELERAFGKNGIQTLILENVLPDLAETANEILDRLPGNTLRVDFATQRERASGDGAIETLEILISDEFGQRPYELYSGGEAFRINFALRVALSLLLAQRAGRRLETLVIDEGFGTQDAKGREGLVQALQAVSDRFALILVVTHLEELKDQFPQRIEVTKTPTGSQVFVLS
jgi:exonuclease SbcC